MSPVTFHHRIRPHTLPQLHPKPPPVPPPSPPIPFQIICGLVGSLGALYTGIVLANLVVALFALVAIASGYESLGRAYAACLGVGLVLDVVWFSFFSNEIWSLHRHFPIQGWAGLSVLLTFYSECVSCVLRVLSAFLWCQMYCLGAATDAQLQYQAMEHENASGARACVYDDTHTFT